MSGQGHSSFLYPRRNKPPYQLNEKFGASRSQSGRSGEVPNMFKMSEIEAWFLGRLVHSSVAVIWVNMEIIFAIYPSFYKYLSIDWFEQNKFEKKTQRIGGKISYLASCTNRLTLISVDNSRKPWGLFTINEFRGISVENTVINPKIMWIIIKHQTLYR
jgi:hypothetical protein